jgi:uncharacterized protein HemX
MPAILRAALPYILIALAVVAAYFFVRQQGVIAAERAQREREVAAYKAQTEKAYKVAQGLEEQLEKTRQQADELNERLKDEISKNGAYRACRVPSGGVQLLNRALTRPASR